MPDAEKLVTIVIPLPKFNDYIREAIPYYEKLRYGRFEIIILPDGPETEILSDKLKITVIPSGKVGPAEKRDLGVSHARGEIIAFIDDDAFPDPDWLSSAMASFADSSVAGVGGPAVTPPHDGFWQKISGNVFESVLSSGGYRKRYVRTGRIHEDYDLPSVNLILRKDLFSKAGGFDSTFYPGEDTKLCLEIKKQGYRILYNPDVLVYHHRRNFFPNHLKQVANYAKHRGFFAKKYPETSRKIAYFLPSAFVVGLVAGAILSFVFRPLFVYYGTAVGLYFLLDLLINIKANPLEYFWTVVGVFLSHLTYGVFFIRGLFLKELRR